MLGYADKNNKVIWYILSDIFIFIFFINLKLKILIKILSNIKIGIGDKAQSQIFKFYPD